MMNRHEYTQEVKEKSRRQLWQHAIRALTTHRGQACLLRQDIFESAWDFCNAVSKRNSIHLDRARLNDWLAFATSRYGSREASSLRVAYLCGPEPENDLRVLSELGVRVENVWAIEQDEATHGEALNRARNTYPALKIYHGGFDSFARVVRERFDVVYLDFTAPLISPQAKPYATLHAIFDEQVLADFGVLIVNVAEPLRESANFAFLTDYFANQPYIEALALQETDNAADASWYSEVAPDQWNSRAELSRDVESRFNVFYSGFCTQYPCVYANRVQPALRLLRVADARRGLFAKDTKVYDAAVQAATDAESLVRFFTEDGFIPQNQGFGLGMDVLMSPSDFPVWWFLENTGKRAPTDKTAKKWFSEYENKLHPIDGNPYRPSRMDAIRLSDLLWHLGEGYFKLAAKPFLDVALATLRAFSDREHGLFCDLPQLHLITQLALNQLGYPHHPVLDWHWRAVYTAKQTPMYLDVFLFDQCRPLYDSLPAIGLYPDHFTNPTEQMITRIGLSCIEGQAHGIVPGLYWASALADRYDHAWSKWATPPLRVDLNTS